MKIEAKKRSWIFWLLVSIPLLIIVGTMSFVGYMFYIDSNDDMVSGQLAPVNHAIKDRCVIKKNGCPKKAEDIVGLDSSFPSILSGFKLWYEYNEKEKYYSLVAVGKYGYGAIFDSRMSTSINEEGVPMWDFKDVKIYSKCNIENVYISYPEDGFKEEHEYQENMVLPKDGIWNRLCAIKPTVF